jgi:hypothetical protein
MPTTVMNIRVNILAYNYTERNNNCHLILRKECSIFHSVHCVC